MTARASAVAEPSFSRYASEVRKHRKDLLQTDTRMTLSGVLKTSDLRVAALTIVAHPEPSRVGERALLPELTGDPLGEAVLSRGEPGFGPPGEAAARHLADPHLSRSPLRLAPSADGSIHLDCSATHTRVEIDGESVTSGKYLTAGSLDRGVVLLLSNRIVLVLHWHEPFIPNQVPHYGMVGESSAVLHVRGDVERVADLEVPVLIRGATGTGKELVARAIHAAGPRRKKPFVAINMAAIPPTLAATELFGAAKGAFTGADRHRAGYFRQAEGGTLFLDEIGETPPEIQVLLLRAIQEGAIRPVGAEQDQYVDVRLLAATDMNLEKAVHEERFREPLLHRLSGYEIQVPPLRSRRDDFGRLFYHFLAEELEQIGERHRLEPASNWLPAALVARLARLEWPGNIRQLGNVVRQLVIASRGAPKLRTNTQVERLLRAAAASSEDPPTAETEFPTNEHMASPRPTAAPRSGGKRRSPSTVTDDELVDALRANQWRLLPSAKALGVSRTSLYELIDRSPKVRRAGDLEADEIEACQERHGGNLQAMAEDLEVSERGLLLRMKDVGLS